MPDDAVALANQAGFLRTVGRNADAQLLESRLLAIEPYPPYHFFQQGLVALQAADYRQAQILINKDLARQPYNAEFHFGLAAVYLAQGELKDARNHLEQAREYSISKDHRALYSAKLEWIENRQLCRKGACENSG
jgi:Flp pilus assembly protein TadD